MTNRWSDIAFPLGPDLKGFCTPKDDVAVLKTSILMICLTKLFANGGSERVMRPTFGSFLANAVHEPNDDILAATIGESARIAIAKWDDRIKFNKYTAQRQGNLLWITLNVTDANGAAQTFSFGVSETDFKLG
jgi:phage baseplate assembly protein W